MDCVPAGTVSNGFRGAVDVAGNGTRGSANAVHHRCITGATLGSVRRTPGSARNGMVKPNPRPRQGLGRRIRLRGLLREKPLICRAFLFDRRSAIITGRRARCGKGPDGTQHVPRRLRRAPMADLGIGPWGEEPTFHAPCFVVTHRPADTIVKKGGTSYTSSSPTGQRPPWPKLRTPPAQRTCYLRSRAHGRESGEGPARHQAPRPIYTPPPFSARRHGLSRTLPPGRTFP
jgi:hypothetical protein